jgi:hypothetical protein
MFRYWPVNVADAGDRRLEVALARAVDVRVAVVIGILDPRGECQDVLIEAARDRQVLDELGRELRRRLVLVEVDVVLLLGDGHALDVLRNERDDHLPQRIPGDARVLPDAGVTVHDDDDHVSRSDSQNREERDAVLVGADRRGRHEPVRIRKRDRRTDDRALVRVVDDVDFQASGRLREGRRRQKGSQDQAFDRP